MQTAGNKMGKVTVFVLIEAPSVEYQMMGIDVGTDTILAASYGAAIKRLPGAG